MKRFAAILSAGLLVWSLFASVPAMPAACGKPATGSTCAAACGGHMACCGTNAPTPPTIPPPASVQNEISLLAPVAVVWILPSQPANLVSSVNVSPMLANGMPLFTRYCAFLI